MISSASLKVSRSFRTRFPSKKFILVERRSMWRTKPAEFILKRAVYISVSNGNTLAVDD